MKREGDVRRSNSNVKPATVTVKERASRRSEDVYTLRGARSGRLCIGFDQYEEMKQSHVWSQRRLKCFSHNRKG